MVARPHDLLRLSSAAVLPAAAPSWAVHALSVASWVVVRRGPAPDGLIAVGVRGSSRSERHGTHVRIGDVREVVAPEDLARVRPVGDLPALRTLSHIRSMLDGTGLAWGPTGSVGFQLATGQPTVTPASDLDLVIRVPHGVAESFPVLTRLHHRLRSLPTRVDCQIETISGAVALAELVGDQPEVMVRTGEGPRLVTRAAMS